MGHLILVNHISMKSIIFLAAIALASAKSVKVKGVEHGFCPGANEPLSLDSLDLSPYPIVVASGAEINLQLQLTLNEVVPEGATADVTIVKKGLVDIPLPCVEVDDLHLGSCQYTGNQLLSAVSDFLCPNYVPDGQECMLPLNPGVYGSTEPYTFVLPDIPQIIVDLLGSGNYEITAHVNYADGSEMTCIIVGIELA